MLKWLLCKLRNKYKFDCVRQSFSVHPKVTARNLYQLAANSGIHCFFVTKLACFPNLPSHNYPEWQAAKAVVLMFLSSNPIACLPVASLCFGSQLVYQLLWEGTEWKVATSESLSVPAPDFQQKYHWNWSSELLTGSTSHCKPQRLSTPRGRSWASVQIVGGCWRYASTWLYDSSLVESKHDL